MVTERSTPPISRAQVEAAAADPRAPTLEAIAARVDACDFRGAAVIALARRRLGHDLPLAAVAEILPGLRDVALALGLIAIASGERATTLLELVERQRFPRDGEAVDVEVIALYAAWRAGAEVARVIPQARRLSRTQLGTVALAVFVELVVAIADRNLLTACGKLDDYRTPAMRSHVAAADRALAASLDQVLAELPDEAVATAGAGFTLRAGPRVGRNEPCPCGSGLKFKKCCADKQVAVAASPIPGLSWDDYVRTAADRMSREDIERLPLHDLARVELGALGHAPLVTAFRRFLDDKRWSQAIRVLDQLAVEDAEHVDEWREALIVEAFATGELAVARAQLAQVRDPEIAEIHREELALHGRDAAAYQALLASADAALRRDAVAQIELAHALLRAAPPLGILAARGCLSADRAADSEVLLDTIEDARDALNLPPGDPAWDVYAALSADADADADTDAESDEARALRSSLHATASRVEQLERELAAKQAELSTARTPAAPAATPDPAAADPERVRALRAKIEELEGLVRAGNSERGELRRQLASARPSAKPAEPELAPARPTEPDEGDEVSTEGRGVVVPSFERRVIDALDKVPRPVAAEAMRTIGGLAAGDGAAWRGVKQARDMARPLLMARIGIHHRLLFRCERDALEVIDLITREELLATLKRVRARG